MFVKDFVKMGIGMFRIVDASKVGYRTRMEVEYEADKNAVTSWYGDWSVVGFEAVGKNKTVIYAKGE